MNTNYIPQLKVIKRIATDLNKVIQSLENIDNLKPPIKWTGSAADLVELTYGIVESKRFNDGDADINTVIQYLCDMFSFEVKDCYDTYRAIRRRVDSRTLLLDEMKEKLNERMDRADEGVWVKRRKNKR
ncbi:hypothetical protein GGR21_000651 [Dysgonomonas hofstadii]|uniref:RteC protein n=1 Tax=Dysgonomonas hofstadii TaxID=637886 RepID=A0A840CMM2_9BACT|nr:RteC domain-containing protein [Dysgonomonas hofstadii]MBB4034764.1 hypothetical protein [Dysgonomonas hofstadii]